MLPLRLSVLLGCFPLLALGVGAEIFGQIDEDTFHDFGLIGTNQRMSAQSVAVLGDYLYIEGGQVSTWVNGEQKFPLNALELNKTLSLPINTKWTKKDVKFTEIPYVGEMRSVKFAGLWANERTKSLYRWGGELQRKEQFEKGHEIKLYVLETDGKGGGHWTSKSLPQAVSSGEIKSNSFGASTFCDNRGFYIGGFSSNSTGDYRQREMPSPGVVTYNMDTGDLSNTTSSPAVSLHDENIWAGQAVCVTAFKRPLVIVLGGFDGTHRDNVRDLGEPIVYDASPASPKWHSQQRAIGDNIPAKRFAFCAVGAQGKNGTYEIFIYGGTAKYGKDETFYGDVWILSLPAFRYFRAGSLSTTLRRSHLACAAVGRYMITIGGISEGGDASWRENDPWFRAIGIFDMVEMTWTEDFDPSKADYDSPSYIKNWYRKNNVDAYGFYDDSIRDLFINAPSDGNDNSDNNEHDSTPIGSIIGGVVGGVALVLLAIGGFWFFRRRRAQEQERQGIDLATLPDQAAGMEPPQGGSHCNLKFSSTPIRMSQLAEAGWIDAELDSTAVLEIESAAVVEMEGHTNLELGDNEDSDRSLNQIAELE
ncbi:unnamed protein product [Clonostachys solani]|uniref:Kelch repeat-containing protein n=1 Tax=Clonostachys solani TaxID=160281 RepID=A0A9N9WBK5_9HYPO|nr:unnamed protein product [Clonostachys solani]